MSAIIRKRSVTSADKRECWSAGPPLNERWSIAPCTAGGEAHSSEKAPNGSERPIKGPQQSERGPWWPSKISRWVGLRPNVLSGAQLMNGPTQYLTRQGLPMAYVKLFLAVFIVHLLSCTSFSSIVACAGRHRGILATAVAIPRRL